MAMMMSQPSPPANIPPAAMGGPMAPIIDGPNSLLEALANQSGPGGPPILPPDDAEMLSTNSSLDGILQLLQQKSAPAPSPQESLLNQVGPGAAAGTEEFDPEMLALMMGMGGMGAPGM